jgi:2-keto-4-pentenoate hydratase/2-oxohepta-3-ene-1,7-dioic acid hydratase in catechol pathway
VTRAGLVGVHHLKLPVSDLEASIAWYQRVLSAQHLSKFDHVDSSGTSYAAILEIHGYTMINDVTARDVMDHEPLQITLSKCLDTFCPVGPHIVTIDEVPNVNAFPRELSTTVNGVYKQQAMTNTMIHSIPTLLEFLTRTVTLAPGDLMSSVTAGGTGVGRTPQEFMHPFDTVTVGVEGVGYLTNPVVAGWTSDASDRRGKVPSCD